MRVLLADDHPMIQAAVTNLLEGTRYEITGSARSASDAWDQIAAMDPDLVLLDIQMPGGTGLEVLRALRGKADGRPIILLTAAIEDLALLEVLSLKVNGIVLKNAEPGLLIDCMDAVCDGRTWIDPELVERVHKLKRSTAADELTSRDHELIRLVRKGLKNRDIAAELGVTEGTVKVYLHRLYEKLGVANRTELAMKSEHFLPL